MINLFTEEQEEKYKREHFPYFRRIHFYILTPKEHIFYKFNNGDLAIISKDQPYIVRQYPDIAAEYNMEYKTKYEVYFCINKNREQIDSFFKTAYRDPMYIFFDRHLFSKIVRV